MYCLVSPISSHPHLHYSRQKGNYALLFVWRRKLCWLVDCPPFLPSFFSGAACEQCLNVRPRSRRSTTAKKSGQIGGGGAPERKDDDDFRRGDCGKKRPGAESRPRGDLLLSLMPLFIISNRASLASSTFLPLLRADRRQSQTLMTNN